MKTIINKIKCFFGFHEKYLKSYRRWSYNRLTQEHEIVRWNCFECQYCGIEITTRE